MDLQEMFGISDAWSASPEDLIDSFFSINGDFLKELDDSENSHFNEIPPLLESLAPTITNSTAITSSAARPLPPITYVGESDFNEFLDAAALNTTATTNHNDSLLVHDVSQYVNYINDVPVSSSSASDSGHSSDNIELDTSPDYEPFSPALSSPGPSISERGGTNSPARSVVSIPATVPAAVAAQPKFIPAAIATAATAAVAAPQPQKYVQQIIAPRKTELFSTVPTQSLTTTSVGKKNVQPPKKELKIYKMAPMMATNGGGGGQSSMVPNKKVTIQVKNSHTKIQPHVTGGNNGGGGTFVINKNNANFSGVRKLVRVQNPSNPRSILLPVSFQDVKDFRTIKIINASNLNNKSANIKLAAANLLHQSKQGLVQKNVLISKEQLIDDSMSDHTSDDAESYVFEDVMLPASCGGGNEDAGHHHSVVGGGSNDSGQQSDDSSDDDDDGSDEGPSSSGMSAAGRQQPHHHQHHHSSSSSYPKLMLTNEEKRLLDKEGISLPANYPLTKHEERELKRIRRKIRNKISAQDSRKRKKEYVDGLEERVKQCTDENQTLIKRLKLLQSQHNNLSGQVKKLQAMLSKGTNKTAQPATCLMVLLLSLALVAVPNLKLGKNLKDTELADALQEGLLQNRRSLLFDTNEQLGDVLVDEEMNLDEILAYSQEVNEHDYAADVSSADVADTGVDGHAAAKKAKTFIEFDVDDRVWRPPTIDNKEFAGKAATYQEYLKNELGTNGGGGGCSAGRRGGGGVDNVYSTLINGGIKQEIIMPATATAAAHHHSGIYEINLNQISMFGGGDEAIQPQQQKLNDSKILMGERKILMKGV